MTDIVYNVDKTSKQINFIFIHTFNYITNNLITNKGSITR